MTNSTTKKRDVATTAPVAKRNTRGQRAGADITLGLRARCAGFWIISRDESRTEQDLIPAIAKAGYRPRIWDIAAGAVDIDGSALRGDPDYNPSEGPDDMLKMIEDKSKVRRSSDDTDRNVWILRDLGPWLDGVGGAVTLRKLRSMLRPDGLSGTPRNVAQAIIILSAGDPPPPALSNGELTVVEWPLPDRDEIDEILANAVGVLPDTETNPLRTTVKKALSQDGIRDAAVDAAVGLSSQEVQTTFARSLIESGQIDVAAIAAEKKRLIDQEPALTYYEPRSGGFDSVGGLDLFKEWAMRTRITFTPEARAYGLKLAKGAMLLGVSGCQPAGSTVLMADGSRKPVERIGLGDRVVSPQADGSVTIETVVRTMDYDADVYRVETTGSRATRSYRAASDHTFPVIDRKGKLVELTTAEFVEKPQWWQDVVRTFTAPAVEFDVLQNATLPIAPYALGLVIGDGCLVGGNAANFTNPDEAMFDTLAEAGLTTGRRTWQKGHWRAYFDADATRLLRSTLGEVKSVDKVIPDAYLRASLKDRLELLAGLIDTDGSAREYTSASKVLAEQFLWLIHSVGGSATMHERETTCQTGAFTSWRVIFSFAEERPNIRVEHKRQPERNMQWRSPRNHGVRVVPDGRERVYGFTLTGESHWYVTDDWMVTRNCGKTLSCQALGSEWGWPVVRLDINALKGKYVGESESRLRAIFAKIDALGQVVVYIDEVEKALQGATSGSADGGVSSDALGAILTWMSDRAGQAFVMMTANDPSALPPEFLRKGRFDEIWFIDLPTKAERAAIAAATLRSNGRDAAKLGIDLHAVADATEGFNGAEIAAAIEHDAMFAAFADGARELTTDDILAAAAEVIPLSRTSGDKIDKLRATWSTRAKLATSPDRDIKQAPPKMRVLDL